MISARSVLPVAHDEHVDELSPNLMNLVEIEARLHSLPPAAEPATEAHPFLPPFLAVL